MASQYSDRVVEGMQALYGRGFLSPGGAEEMVALLDGVALAGKRVLDIGCGLGGAALMLAGDFGARHVTSIDIAADLVARAGAAVRSAGLDGRVDVRHVSAGRLPFDDAGFDVVFAKDVVCHIQDKAAAFGEAARVLAPGGLIVCADFTVPEEGPLDLFEAWTGAMRAYGLTFHFEGLEVYREAFRGAGFGHVAVRDDTARSLAAVEREVAYVTGGEAGELRQALGEAMFARRVEASVKRRDALAGGGVLHTHMVANRRNSA